jgi:hypothetical protein
MVRTFDLNAALTVDPSTQDPLFHTSFPDRFPNPGIGCAGGGEDRYGGMVAQPAGFPHGAHHQPQPAAASVSDEESWWYIDKQGHEQGPMRFSQLQNWYSLAHFAADFKLFDRANPAAGWVTYADAYRRRQMLGTTSNATPATGFRAPVN